MGTSQSSKGPGKDVPMVPPWTPDFQPVPSTGDEPVSDVPVDSPSLGPVLLAPAARFATARRSLGEFARSGDVRDLGRGLRHYIQKGYGGAKTTTQRFGGTATTAGALHNALSSIAAGRPAAPGSPLDPALLAGRSAQEVMDAVVEAVRPVNGTQDAEASRAAIRDALAELLTRFPETDLLNLDAEQRSFAIEHYAAIDVFKRFELDVGKTILDKSPSAVTALSRLKEVRDYIKEAVAASFRTLRDQGQTIASGRINQVVHDALRETFQIFEGYSE